MGKDEVEAEQRRIEAGESTKAAAVARLIIGDPRLTIVTAAEYLDQSAASQRHEQESSGQQSTVGRPDPRGSTDNSF